MNKILAYYSLIIIIFCIVVCIFDSEGDSDTFFGALMFIPVAYSVWQMITELKEVEKENKQKEEVRKYEEIKKEVRSELNN